MDNNKERRASEFPLMPLATNYSLRFRRVSFGVGLAIFIDICTVPAGFCRASCSHRDAVRGGRSLQSHKYPLCRRFNHSKHSTAAVYSLTANTPSNDTFSFSFSGIHYIVHRVTIPVA